MGLFVGASVITVFELCDALLHNFLKLKMNQHQENKRQKTPRRENGKVRIDVLSFENFKKSNL